ncbi:hypothetical protein SAMN04487787_10747 [Kosakonia sacchari]|nr:hypothetical protein SAMN04487787_10747 [Kosakonia sacchari]
MALRLSGLQGACAAGRIRRSRHPAIVPPGVLRLLWNASVHHVCGSFCKPLCGERDKGRLPRSPYQSPRPRRKSVLRTTLTSRSSALRLADFSGGLNPIASAFLFIEGKVSLQGNTRWRWRLPGLHCWPWRRPDKAKPPSGGFAKVVRRGGRRYAPARPSRDALHHGPGFPRARRAAYRQLPLAH